MKRWLRLAWLLVSGAWFIRLQFIPVLQWARFPTFDPPRGFNLWINVARDWRHGWLFFATVGTLVLGFLLEVRKNRAAMYFNVGFYAAYVLLLIPGLVEFFRNKLEAEAVLYMVVFGKSALVILVVNYLLYRNRRQARRERHA